MRAFLVSAFSQAGRQLIYYHFFYKNEGLKNKLHGNIPCLKYRSAACRNYSSQYAAFYIHPNEDFSDHGGTLYAELSGFHHLPLCIKYEIAVCYAGPAAAYKND